MSNTSLIAVKPLESTELVKSLEDALSLGEIVAKSGMFPDVTTQAQAVVKILAGRELGVPAMAALRGIHVIKGKAEIGAGLLAAMVKASGRYDYRVQEHSDQSCLLSWYENGNPVGVSEFTMADAKRAKLLKPDSNWEKFPKAMLFARALTAGQRAYAPDIAIGAVYAEGEIPSDMDDQSLMDIPYEAPEQPSAEWIQQRFAAARERYEPEPVEASDDAEFRAKPDEMRYEEIRMQIHAMASALHDDYGINNRAIVKRISEKMGRAFERIGEIADSECQDVWDDLSQWLRELNEER